jgi:predicted nuclease of predicted toxin-antitoxin system
MKFLVDAQLPKSLAALLNQLGADAIHTIDLPDKNKSKDGIIAKLAKDEGRVVVTKDSDFLESYLVKKEPSKVLILKTGNIKNQDILDLFTQQLPLLQKLFKHHDLIEMSRTEIIVHQ